MSDQQADAYDIVLQTLRTCTLRDQYTSEQQQLQPDLRDALRQVLGSKYGVEISVRAGEVASGPKPRVALFGTTFWPDIEVRSGDGPIVGVEVKHLRRGQRGSSKAIEEAIGAALIYRLLYPRAIAFILREGIAETEPPNAETHLRRMLTDYGIDLMVRYR